MEDESLREYLQLGEINAMNALFAKIDCVSLKVTNLQSGIDFYSRKLGHPLKWKSSTMAGKELTGCDAELVIHTDERPMEAEFLVDSVPAAIDTFKQVGGKLIKGPFEIQIGKCAVLSDPWGNRIVLVDMSKGAVQVDANKNVIVPPRNITSR